MQTFVEVTFEGIVEYLEPILDNLNSLYSFAHDSLCILNHT